ncbi:MAG: HEAT repeat domain-containing protein, partial [Planctomycetaceae bacterium]|nr:HEAT repeat domain-containing protein [Planctomycetaceae bacterium]
TFRSGRSGVYRFNPRTFETEFHFPIGPNPHGDVFDRWGYQFANDGTSGTGSYVNIGKGIGNRHWFVKRVRPVPATGILSSSHFPPELQNNFLISNAIGFLGVLQHEVHYNGAEITAEEVDPIMQSDDPNFRPSDLEIGGDGALYIADWHNALIGHMQHNMRDPNRDQKHGRIYRVTYKGRDLLEPVKLRGKPIEEVCQAFHAAENSTRYRARLELTGRDSEEVISKVTRWAATQDVSQPADAQALLECLWVLEEQRAPNGDLLRTVFQAEEPRVRAAAIRTLGHWAGRVNDGQQTLLAAARDESPLVRAEAVKAAVEFGGPAAAEVIFEVSVRPLDPELDIVLQYATEQIPVDQLIHEAIQAGKPLSQAGLAYALKTAPVDDLLRLERTAAVYEAVLSRPEAPVAALREALNGLAALKDSQPLNYLLQLIADRDAAGQTKNLSALFPLFGEQKPADLQTSRNRIEQLALTGRESATRRLAFAALIQTDGTGNRAWFAASKSKGSLRDFLAAVPQVTSDELRGSLYDDVRSLMFELPPGLDAEPAGSELQQTGIRVEYFAPSGPNVALETLAKMKPKASGIVPKIELNVPQRQQPDKFALKFTGMISVPKSGRYTFYTSSDDGSRLFVDGQQIVNNDGLHGMTEKSGKVQLSAGLHDLVVTYFDNGGGDGLVVSWAGPGVKKQEIPVESLSISGGGETLHDAAVRSLVSIPGHEAEKFADLVRLVQSGRSRLAAISVLNTIPAAHWPEKGREELVDNLIGYLSTIPARLRTGGAAVEAIALTRSLAKTLPAATSTDIEQRLQNLDVRVIAIGTV